MTRQQKVQIAHHEAGHAVVACRLHKFPSKVTILPNKSSSGRAVFRRPLLQEGMQSDNSPRNWLRIEHDMIIAMAGPLAQRRYAPRSDWRQNRYWGERGTDFDIFADLLLLQHDDEKVRDAYARYIRARAESLVENGWPAIERVAQALVDQQTLSREELSKTIWPGLGTNNDA